MNPEDFPQLKTVIGDSIIVTDGTTLLGNDDKAGIAIIMQTLDELKIRISLTEKLWPPLLRMKKLDVGLKILI